LNREGSMNANLRPFAIELREVFLQEPGGSLQQSFGQERLHLQFDL